MPKPYTKKDGEVKRYYYYVKKTPEQYLKRGRPPKKVDTPVDNVAVDTPVDTPVDNVAVDNIAHNAHNAERSERSDDDNEYHAMAGSDDGDDNKRNDAERRDKSATIHLPTFLSDLAKFAEDMLDDIPADMLIDTIAFLIKNNKQLVITPQNISNSEYLLEQLNGSDDTDVE